MSLVDAASRSCPRVLVVEESALMAMELRSTLEAIGCEVTEVATSWRQARPDGWRQRPDVVLVAQHPSSNEELKQLEQLVVALEQPALVVLMSFIDERLYEMMLRHDEPFCVARPLGRAALRAVIDAAIGAREDRELRRCMTRAVDERAIGVMLLADGGGAWTNEGYRELTGMSAAQDGRRLLAIPEAEGDEELSRLRQSVHRQEAAEGVVEWLGDRGQIRAAHVKMAPMRKPSGAIYAMMVTAKDATERVEMRRTLAAEVREDTLQQAVSARLEGLQARLALLGDEQCGVRKPRRMLAEAGGPELRALGEQVMLLADRLDQAEEPSAGAGPVDLVCALEEHRSVMQTILGAQTRLQVQTTAESCRVKLTSAQVSDLLESIAGGCARLEPRPVALVVKVRVANAKRGDREAVARFEISGAANLDAWPMQAWERLRGAVEAIVEPAMGQLRVGLEATHAWMQVRLPITTTSGSSVSHPHGRDYLGGRRIWMVDGDPNVREQGQRALDQFGASASTFSDGIDALRALERGEIPDIVILGTAIGSPGGEVVLDALASADGAIQAVQLISSPEDVLSPDGRSIPLLWKPFAVDSLLRVLEEAAERHQALSEASVVSVESVVEPRNEAPDLSGDVRLQQRFRSLLDTVKMHYQPLIRAATSTLYGYEALMRSDDPNVRGPGELLSMAERVNGMELLGLTCRQRIADDLAAQPSTVEPIFVNVHPLEFSDALARPGEPLLPHAHRIVLEVTEQASIAQSPELTHTLRALRRVGYRVALDDLGQGYAGLVSLYHLQPDVVKIDMSLVRDIHQNRFNRDMIRALQVFFRAHVQDVVAEGIECVEEAEVLVDLGSTILQGYWFGRPAPPFARDHRVLPQ